MLEIEDFKMFIINFLITTYNRNEERLTDSCSCNITLFSFKLEILLKMN